MEMDEKDERRVATLERHQVDVEKRTNEQDVVIMEIRGDIKQVQRDLARIDQRQQSFNEKLGRWVERIFWATIAAVATMWDKIVQLKGGG